jgi:hypothetical protein
VKLFGRIAATLACIALICGAAFAWHSYEVNSHERKRADAARVSAEQGDAKAQVDLATMYYHGQGVRQDYAEAALWYRKAADQGNAIAQNAIGSMYYYANGVPQDYAEAARWYRKAADQGYARAQYNLGLLYDRGQGVPQDYAEGLRWYRKAADQGNARAEYGIGYKYYHGQGMTQDYTEALRWFHKAADQGDAGAEDYIGLSYYYGHGIPQSRTEGNRWFRKAADQGDEYALDGLSEKLTEPRIVMIALQLFFGTLLVFSFLPTNFLISGKGLRDLRQKVISGAGVLCLMCAGLSWYGYTHYKIRSLANGVNAFMEFRWLLELAFIALITYVVLSKSEKRQGEMDPPQADGPPAICRGEPSQM